MNAGALASHGDVLFFLHCDSELPEHPLEQIREVMKDYQAGCFGIAFHSKNFFMFTCRVISNHRIKDRKVMFGDQGIFIERELFFEIGMFPEIPVMEDYQLSLTLKERGVKLGMTRKRIYTSDRRFPKGTIPKLKLMWKMNRLRKMYRDRVPIETISDLYRGRPLTKDEERKENMKEKEMIKAYVRQSSYRQALALPDEVTEEYEMLAQGEYNRNYLFTHPLTGKKLLLRVNFGSQMHLDDQIEYEYKALKILETSGRTPKPLYVDGRLQYLPYGVMVIEYLPGRVLDYHTDLPLAAACLADIHSVAVPEETHLIAPANQIRAILEECEEMFAKYQQSPMGDEKKKERIRRMLDLVWKKADSLGSPRYRCCINTELNSTNFLINGSGKGKLPDRLGKASLRGAGPGSGAFSGAYHHLLENGCDPGC